MENRKRIITTFCLNCDILIDLICPIHHAAPDNRERERAFLWEISNSRNKKGELYRERPSVAGIYTFLDFETPQQEAGGGIRPSDNLKPD